MQRDAAEGRVFPSKPKIHLPKFKVYSLGMLLSFMDCICFYSDIGKEIENQNASLVSFPFVQGRPNF